MFMLATIKYIFKMGQKKRGHYNSETCNKEQ